MPAHAIESHQQERKVMEPFVHSPEYPFVICKRCKVGFVTSEVVNHLKTKHGHIDKKERQRIKQAVAACDGVSKDQAELRGWVLPPPTIGPNPYIKAPQQDGLGCNHCIYVVREVRRIREHCRDQHGWINSRKKGGRHRAGPQAQPVPWRSGVQCQQVCHWGHGRRWFEVGRPESDTQRQARAREEDKHQDVVKFFDRIYREDEAAFETEAQARIQDHDDKHDADRWLNRCGWPRHLEGIERDELRRLLEPIGDDEAVLQRMWQILEGVLDSAYGVATRCEPGTAELYELERKEAHITTSKPFAGLMEADAWARYKAWWKTLMSIWKRMEEMGGVGPDESRDGEGSAGEGEEDDTDSSSVESTSRGSSSSTGGHPTGRPRRPPYRMTIRQEELWKEFDRGVTAVVKGTGRAHQYSSEGLQRSCLDVVIQFFDHPFKNGSHYENIVISALAVMGFDSRGGGWVKVVNYTPIYSAVVKVARYLVLYQSMLERQGQEAQLRQYMSAREADESADGLFRIVRHKVVRFMTRTSEGGGAEPTPMNWIINTRRYGMKIRFTTPGRETIDWRHGDQIIHNQIKTGMSEISDMLHSLVRDTRRTLVQLATGRMEKRRGEQAKAEADAEADADADEYRAVLPRIPWSRIEDRHGESALEHSFLTDDDNQPWVQTGEHWVQKQIKAQPERFRAWVRDPLDEQCPYREKTIRAYGRAIETFRGQMFVLMHMLGGQPARATELLGLRMWNTANGGVRNIFMHEGMVCFVTMYHKGFRQSGGDIKVIHRYLPREVGELLVWYMWLVLPFWQVVQGRMKQKRRRSAFLWADQVVSQDGSKDGRGSSRAGTEEAEEEAAFMDWFRESKWTSDRARRVMQRYTTQFSGQEINVAAWRMMAIAISNRFFNKVFGDDEWGEEEEDGEGGFVDSIHDLQAGHGSQIAGLIYARLFGQGEAGTMRSREEFRKVSMQWHRFFGFGAEDRAEWTFTAGGSRRRRRGRVAIDDAREEMRRRRFGRLHRTDMQGQLRQMIGPAAAFRGLQEPVIRALARGEWPIVQVTPTGGGKSMTFMLPAYCTPEGVTVVITPLVSLQDDMADRCAKLGIDAYVWRSGGVQRGASLVFVTPESAVGKGFRVFIERMCGQERLDRVVVDECHTAMRFSKTFRPQMGRLGDTLRDFGVPVVCLTATLKPAHEIAFYRQMQFKPERVRMFREPTTRPNIQYRVDVMEDGGRATSAKTSRRRQGRRGEVAVNGEGEEEGVDDEELVDRACAMVRAWTGQHEQGKVIIYGGTIKRVKGIADRLGCAAYWRGAGNVEEKARRVAEWRSSSGGEAGWIAATNALGLGVDDPNVRLVVHVGMPRQLEDFVQESGRGGRDGKKSESVVVIRRTWIQQQQEREREGGGQAAGDMPDQKEWAWDKDAVEFAEGKCCRRVVLDREMDGSIDRFGCGEGEETCDICREEEMVWHTAELAEGGELEAMEAREAVEEADYQRSRRLGQQVEAEGKLQAMEEAVEIVRGRRT
ncbi:ATP-dependent DNA helicase Q1 [Fusarium albosuccineum]|uniref:DNA 3'-5' helicase n=1 Tax=Fusarium albosuccineum TaxID=1237068 RepID=A0A8H4LP69_9HYPO|nr:ATP-dependent DNA helicase Q1 [Fusarium albosuccineum]